MGKEQRRKRKKTNKQALQHLHQQGGQEGLHTILVKEEEKRQGGGHQGKQASQQWGQTLLGAKGDPYTIWTN